MKELIKKEFDAHIKAAISLHGLTDKVAKTAELCIDCLQNGGKILLFGNGGSAADAQHIAAELVGKYKIQRNGISAIALTTDTSVITSIGNDFGYEHIFDRQVEALANDGDVLIGISTSGKSLNVINAAKGAKNIGASVVTFSGFKSDNPLRKLGDVNFWVNNDKYNIVESVHNAWLVSTVDLIIKDYPFVLHSGR